jgi:hypothetical protein
MIDLNGILGTLCNTRPIFHSEADFQHALAWQIHQQCPTACIRLEYPFSPSEPDHLDIFAFGSDCSLAIELKYKTRRLFATIDGEIFRLKDHSAQDCGRYDFVSDIERLEQFVSSHPECIGYAILLTNDSLYWDPPRSVVTVDASFRVHEGRLLHGTLGWGEMASKGTTKSRERAIAIKGTYNLSWRDYREVKPSTYVRGYRRFRYLMVMVGGTPT